MAVVVAEESQLQSVNFDHLRGLKIHFFGHGHHFDKQRGTPDATVRSARVARAVNPESLCYRGPTAAVRYEPALFGTNRAFTEAPPRIVSSPRFVRS